MAEAGPDLLQFTRETIRPGPSTEIPRSPLSESDIRGPYEALARGYDELAGGLERLGSGMEKMAVPLAERQAAEDLNKQKVTRDANGNIQILNPANSPLMLGEAGDVYRRAVRAGTVAQAGNVMSQAFTEAHQKYPLDPQGFKSYTDSMLTNLQQNYGGTITGQSMLQHGRSLQTEHYDHITNSAMANDVANQKTSIEARITSSRDTLMGLARQNGTESPEFKTAWRNYADANAALSANPLFKKPKELIDVEMKRDFGLMQGQAVLGHISDVYNNAPSKEEGYRKAEALANSIETDPKFNSLSPENKQSLRHQALSEIRMQEGIRKSNIQDLRQSFTMLQEGSMERPAADVSRDVDTLADAFSKQGDMAGAARVKEWGMHHALGGVADQPLSQQTEAIERLRGSGGVPDRAYYAGLPKAADVYAKIPATGERGEDQLARFRQWNPDPVGNSAGLLSTVHPDLQAVVRKAQADNPNLPFVVGLGKTTQAQEAQAQAWGWGQGGGRHKEGLAVDLWPLDKDGHVVFDKDKQQAINAAMQKAAGDLGQSLRWGGLVSEGGANKSFRDAPYFELLNPKAPEAAATAPGIAGFAEYKARVRQIESGGNDAAVSPAGAVGRYQFMPTTWASYGASADIRGNQEAAMDRFTNANWQTLSQGLGRNPTWAELYLAHQQGPQAAMRLLAEPNRRAADIVGEKAITMNGGRADMTAGDFTRMWEAKFNHPGFAKGFPALQGPAAGQWELAARERIEGKALRSTWTDLMKGWDTDQEFPPNDKVAEVIRGAEITQDAPMLDRISRDMTRIQVVQTLGDMPIGVQNREIAGLQSLAGGGQLEDFRGQMLKNMEQQRNALETSLEKNPVSTTVARSHGALSPPSAIDWNDPASVKAGMAQRGHLADLGAEKWGTGPLSALDQSDVRAARAALLNPDPNVKAGIFGAIAASGMSPQTRNATLRAITSNEPSRMVEAVGGALMADHPDVGGAIFHGQAALAADDRLAPKKENWQQAMDSVLPPADFPQADGRAATLDAVKAYYAYQSAKANDTSQNTSTDRINQAVEAVTGGVRNFRGSRVFAPWYGASDDDLDRTVRSLTDQDFANARTARGEAFPASALQSSGWFISGRWRLESQDGGGRYFVFSGADNARSYLLDSSGGNRFVLDLGAKRAPEGGNVINIRPGQIRIESGASPVVRPVRPPPIESMPPLQ